MSVGSALVLAFLAVLAVGMSAVAVRAWRDPRMTGDRVPFARLLPFGPEARVAFGRALVPWSGILVFVVVIGIVTAVRGARPSGSGTDYVVRIVGLSAAAGVVLAFGAVLTIAWFNSPKFLVPPHRRNESGLFRTKRSKAGRGPR